MFLICCYFRLTKHFCKKGVGESMLRQGPAGIQVPSRPPECRGGTILPQLLGRAFSNHGGEGRTMPKGPCGTIGTGNFLSGGAKLKKAVIFLKGLRFKDTVGVCLQEPCSMCFSRGCGRSICAGANPVCVHRKFLPLPDGLGMGQAIQSSCP